MKTLFFYLFLNNASQGLQFGSRWVLNLFLLTALSTSSFADFTFIYALANILLSVFPFGSSVYIINTKLYNKDVLLKSINIINAFFFLSLLAYILMYILLRDMESIHIIWLGLILAYVLSLNFVLFSYFKSISNFINELRAYIFFSVILLGSFFVIYNLEKDFLNLYSVFTILIVSNLIIFVYSARKEITLSQIINKEHLLDIKDLIKSLKSRFYFGFQEILTAIYSQGGMLILYYLLTNDAYKTYRSFFIIVAPFFMFSVAFTQVMLNRMKRLTGKKLISVFRKTQVVMLLISVLLSVFILLFRDFIFIFLKMDLSNENITSFYLIILILNIRFIFANYEILFIVLNKQPFRFYVMLVSAILNIVLIFILVPMYDLLGAMYVYVISYAAVLIGLVLIGEIMLVKPKRNNLL